MIVSGFVPLGCAFGQETASESREAFRTEFEGKGAHVRSAALLEPTFASRTPGTGAFSFEGLDLEHRDFHAADLSEPLLDLRVPELQPFASPEFRQHGPSLSPKPKSASDVTALALVSDESFWKRLGDFRCSGGLRLLTLWKSSWSTLSLQAGKRGGPSLQWTSSRMNHDGAKSGLFDTFIPVTFEAEGAHSQLSGPHSSHPTERLRDLMPDPVSPPR